MKQLNKYFVFSDVHGEYDALIESLNAAGYNPNDKTHKLISLGDNFDRGPQSKQIFRYLYEHKAICVKGNHDAMFQEYLEKGMDGEFVLFNILHNGLAETISSFSGLLDRQFSPEILQHARNNIDKRVLLWIQNMPLYYETETFIFCHAGINPRLPDWKQTDEHHILWDIENSCMPCPNTGGKIVVIGHHHAFRVRKQAEENRLNFADVKDVFYTNNNGDENGHHPRRRLLSYGNEDENAPVIIDNKIAIDGCTNLTHKVNVLVIEDYEMDDGKSGIKENEPSPDDNLTQYSYVKGVQVNTNGRDYTYYVNTDTVAGININDFYVNNATVYETTRR